MTVVTEQTNEVEQAYLELHGKYLEDGGGNETIRKLNATAMGRFEELRLPHSKHEMFTYVNTREITAAAFEFTDSFEVASDEVKRHIYADSQNSFIVLVNGKYRQDLSELTGAGDVKVSGIETGLKSDAIRQYVHESIEEENDVFASLNSAFFGQGVFIEVGPKVTMETPLQILHLSTAADKQVMSIPRVLVHVGKNASAKFIIKFAGIGEDYFVNSVHDFILEENCGVSLTQVQEDSPRARHFNKTRVIQKQYSRFNTVQTWSGTRLTRNNFETHLKESGAEIQIKGVAVLKEEEQAHQYMRIYHEAPACTSDLQFKNVLNGKSRSSIDGTVIVENGAQMTSSNQLINNLVLSDDAHADGKPNLMIYADDVKCAHGNTVGQIDEAQLFYLKTRGLKEDVAKTLLTTSFAQSIVESIPFAGVVEDLNKTLLKKLEI